ncbi:unnamed protein product, partial [Rotaria sp. Silwood2]
MRFHKFFLLSLHFGDINAIKIFLVEENKEAEGISHSRTVCIMDATCSMFHLLHKYHEINSNSFQIQFFVYRNYNSREDKILQSPSWETKPHNLRIGDASSNTKDK